MFRMFLFLLLLAGLTSCAGVRRTYQIKGEAEKVKFEYRDSVQQFKPLK